MASRILRVYKDTFDAINAITKPVAQTGIGRPTTEKVFKYTNIWDEQIRSEVAEKGKEATYSFAPPAVFVEFNLGKAMQLGMGFTSFPEAELNFYIISFCLDGREGKMERNEKVFDLRDKLKTKFGKSSLSFCSSLMSNIDEQDFNHDNVYIWKLGYKTNFIDSKGSPIDEDSGATVGFLVNPTLNLNVFFSFISGKEYFSNLGNPQTFYTNENGFRYISYEGIYYITSSSGGGDENGLFANVVSLGEDVYICLNNNSDLEIKEENWLKISGWIPKTYVAGDIVAFYSMIYKCTTDNNDAIFNEDNWKIIVG